MTDRDPAIMSLIETPRPTLTSQNSDGDIALIQNNLEPAKSNPIPSNLKMDKKQKSPSGARSPPPKAKNASITS